jgi:hypothetical protein
VSGLSSDDPRWDATLGYTTADDGVWLSEASELRPARSRGCEPVSGHADTRTLEDLLEAGEVECALIVKGDYTPQELELIRAAFGEGVKLGKQSAEAKIVEQAGR